MVSRQAVPQGRASVLASAVLAAVVPLLGATPAPGSISLPASVCGTWVLEQPSTVAELHSLQPETEAALALPGVVGFSLRFPWKAVDTDFSMLEEALAIARAKGKAFTIRAMAGRHTPARVFDAGSPYYTLSTGEKVPTPFYPDGSPNVVFEQAYDEFVGRLAAWSRANGVRLLHLPWYGQDWAELNYGPDVRSAPGYSLNAWLGAHRRLIDIAARYSGPDLAVEMPLSGSGPLANGPSAALADYVISSVGAGSDRFFVQANGWGPNGDWGTTSATTEALFDQIWLKPVRRGEQAIQSQDYDWTLLYSSLYANDATYAEVYVHSFSMARKALLAAEIEKFATTRCVAPAPVDGTPPTVAVDAPAPGARVAGALGVSISAADDQGSVTRVELVVDGTVAGSADTAPATIAWDTTTVGDGAHVLSARATDDAGNVGVSPPVAVTVDNTGPAVPGGLSATPGDAEVNVAFEAVTAADLAGYEVRSKPSSSAVWEASMAVTSTSATFTGLVNGTSYDFSVRSRDDLGNPSAWSAVASAVPAAADAPAPTVVITAPTGGARVAGTVGVSFEAAVTTGSVLEVELLVDGDPVGSAAAASATIPWDTTTLADGAHVLSARAVDDAGNVGTSPSVSVTVDNTAPAVPGGLSTTPGDGQVTVTFQAVSAPDLAACDAQMKPSSSSTWGTPVAITATTAAFTGLTNGTSYDFSVRSRDTLGNTSLWSAAVTSTPVAPDTTAPVVAITAPTGGARVASTVGVSIQASDAGSVVRIELLVDGQPIGSAAASSTTIPWDTTTLAGGAHVLSARAVDSAGNVGTSAPVSVAVDNDAPAVPGGLTAAPGDRQITVTYLAVSAADVAGYDARMKPSSSSTWGAPVAITATTATFTGLTNGTSYDFSVRSRDTLGNTSAWSTAVSATPRAPDTQAPSAPAGLKASQITRSSIQVCWNPSTDNVGVAGYRVYRNGVLVATTTSTCQLIGNLNPKTAYTITVRAFDAAGNVSAVGSITVRTHA